MAQQNYLDKDGVLYFWQKIKNMFATKTEVGNKVDKVDGKSLSTNDYTTAEKTKLAGIEEGANVVIFSQPGPSGEVDVKNSSGDTIVTFMTDTGISSLIDGAISESEESLESKIDEKVDKISGKGLSTEDYTTAEKTKLAGIDEGAKKISYGLEGAHLVGIDKLTSNNIYTHVTYDFVRLIGSDNTNLAVLDKDSALSMLNDKVNKVTGKGLSTNDYTTAEKNKLASFGSADTYALKTDITGMYKYKGSVATVSALPSTDNTTGDVYNVESSGMNYAWNGTAWDSLGEIFQITSITNAEIDAIVAS